MWHPLWVSVNFQGVCVTQQICAYNCHASYRPIGPMMCVNYALYCFWMIFSSYFVFVSCMNFIKFSPSVGSVYWFHSTVVPLAYVPVWCCVLIWQVWSQWIICHILSVHYIVTYANHSPLVGIDLYKMGRNLDRSDLTELWGRFDILHI